MRTTRTNLNRLALLAVFLIAQASICCADQAGPYTYTITDGKATITAFDRYYSGSLTITNELGGAPVTIIGPSAFSNCYGLSSATIPDSVTSIGPSAFYYCSGLTNATPAIPVAMEACTNLSEGPWLRLQTTNLADGTCLFSDPAATTASTRFYRIVGP